MNICVFADYRFVTCPTISGVGKHIVHMVQGLRERNGNTLAALATSDQAASLGPLAALPVRHVPLPWKLADGLWTVSGLPYADRWSGSPDWVYCPKNDYLPIRKARVAVTVHGAHELDPLMPQSRNFSARLNRLRRRTSYRRMLGQAALVLAVSEFLKEQMVRWFQVEPEKCCVVGNGVEPDFFHVAGKKARSSGEPANREFVLCVGGLNYLDGGDRVLGLASLLRTKAPDIRVLVAGNQHEEPMKRAAAELPNVTLLGYVPADRLALYMRDSFALYYPTRYETFGIAAAEAMAAGTPVITCRCTAVPEILGDAGIYVNADQPEAAVEALMSLHNQPGLRSELIARGRRRANAYTWGACVSRLQQALEKN